MAVRVSTEARKRPGPGQTVLKDEATVYVADDSKNPPGAQTMDTGDLEQLERTLADTVAALREIYHVEALTPREYEVLAWVSLGGSNAEIGRSLGIAPSTVSTHVRNLMRKLGVHSRIAAVAQYHAIRAGTDRGHASEREADVRD